MAEPAQILAERICTLNAKVRVAQKVQDRAKSKGVEGIQPELQQAIEVLRNRLDEVYTIIYAMQLRGEVGQILKERGEEAI